MPLDTGFARSQALPGTVDTDDRTSPPPPTGADLEPFLRSDDVRVLLEAAEQSGLLRAAELAELVEAHELDALEQDALARERTA